MDPGHQAHHARFRADRFARRPRRLDRGKIPHLERLRRRYRIGHQQGPLTGEYLAVLVHRRDRLFVLALLRSVARPVADPKRRDGRCADGICGVPEGNHPPASVDRAADVHQHSALDGHAARRALRGDGAAGGAGRRDQCVFPAAADCGVVARQGGPRRVAGRDHHTGRGGDPPARPASLGNEYRDRYPDLGTKTLTPIR